MYVWGHVDKQTYLNAFVWFFYLKLLLLFIYITKSGTIVKAVVETGKAQRQREKELRRRTTSMFQSILR